MFNTGTLDGFKGAVNLWLLPSVVFSSLFHGAGACGVAKQLMDNIIFPTWACNNNNNNNVCASLFMVSWLD